MEQSGPTMELPYRQPTTLVDVPETMEHLESLISKYVVQEGPNKWRCTAPECNKLFKSQYFWRKHATNRHGDLLDKLEAEMEDEKLQSVDDDTCSCGSWQAVSDSEDGDADYSASEHSVPDATTRLTPSDYNKFTWACASGCIEMLSKKLEEGIDIERETTKGYTALVVAITEGQIEAVEILLEHGADPNHRVADLSPLAHAAKNIDHGPEIMRLLLQCGACLKSVSGLEAMTPLHFAAMEGTPESIKFLIEKGSNIESKCRRGCTPLLLAAETGNTRTARSLLGLGANIDARSNNGGTVLSWSSCNDHTETMKLWLRSGVDIDARDRNGLTSLFVASHFGCTNAIKLLLEEGADTSITSIKPDGFSVVMAAAVSNYPEAIQVLTDNGCEISLQNGDGKTALDLAFVHRKKGTVQILLEIMSPGSFHPKDSVALQMALAKNHTEMAAFVSAATLMYPYVGFKFETPGEFAWMEWVLNEGGNLVKPWAMRKLLHVALDEANVLMLKALQSHGCDFNCRLESGLTPLALCVRSRQRHMTEILLNAGANPNQQSSKDHFRSAFDDAIVSMKDEDDTEYVHLLLDTGRCQINKGTNPASTAFSHVLSKIDKWSPGTAVSLAKRMLDNRAMRHTTTIDEDRDELNCTMLHVAVLRDSEEMIHYLLDAGADLEAQDQFGVTPFLLACQHAAAMLPILVEKGANLEARYTANASAVVAAAAHGNVESLQFLTEKGLDINAATEKGYSPLACALTWAQEEAALFLMEKGADLHWKTKDEVQTALHFAARHKLERPLRLLLEKMLGVNAQNSDEWTPLHEACATGNSKVVEMLLDAGADIEMELPNKDRPLHVALINEQEDIVQLLLKRGTNVTARASNNRTPLHLAAEYSLPRATLTLLESHGVSTEDIDEETWTPLCCCNTSEVAQILIDHGADVNYADKDDWTPLHQAVHKRDTALVKLLLSSGADVKIRTTDDGLTIEERMQHVDDVRGHPIFERILKQVAALRQESVRDLEDDDIEIVNRVEEIV